MPDNTDAPIPNRLAALMTDYYFHFDSETLYEIKEILSISGSTHIVASVIYYLSEAPHIHTWSAIVCECEFTPNVGWSPQLKRQLKFHCIDADSAILQREGQLRSAYTRQYGVAAGRNALQPYLKFIIDDLTYRVEHLQWPIERSADAQLLDGYYFVETIARITDVDEELVCNTLSNMQHARHLRVEVVTSDLFESAIGKKLVMPYRPYESPSLEQ